MTMFEFSIIASGLDPRAENFEARFYEAGCDDALVSFQRGRIIVDFAREADSVEAALSSALDAVRRAGARVERVEPDPLVGLSEIAQRSGLTRAAVHNYAKGDRRGDFPPPVARVTTASPLWDWAEVSGWLHRQGVLPRDAWMQALAVDRANAALRRQPAPEREVA
jgi:predicted DNA-binding transcriptional regulator AlpA